MFSKKILVFFAFEIVIILLAWILLGGRLNNKVTLEVNNEDKYPYLAKRVLTDSPNDPILHFSPLRRELRDYTSQFGNDLAFYFEYLPTGVSIGVNDKEEILPASLGKIPLVMAYYLEKERKGGSLDEELEIKEEDIDKKFGDLWKKGVGTKVKVSELIRLTLEESDNTSVRVLASNVSDDEFKEVFEGLDILYPADRRNKMTIKEFSSVMKALYFASVINKDDSQEIIKMLLKSIHRDKIPSVIPNNVPVANKIGVYDDGSFRDCALVYVPQRQYLLCIYSKGSEDQARERMRKISELIYQYVTKVD